MRNTIFIFLLLLTSCFIFSQEGTKKISITYSDLSLQEVLDSIEVSTDYRFYYVDEWLSDQKISGSYEDVDLNEVLDCLLYTSPSPRDQRGSRMPSSA